MGDHRFVAGQRLVTIRVGVGHDGFAAGSRIARAEIKVSRHALPGAGRSVVERKHSVDPGRVVALLTVGLSDAYSESLVALLAIPDVTEIHLQLPREEKLVWRREERDRSAAAFCNRKPVASAQHDLRSGHA